MADLNIKRAVADDLPQVLKMIHALADHHGDTATIDLETLERDALGDRPWVTLLVAKMQGDVAGYAVLCPLVQMQFAKRGMDMHHLFVLPQHRGKRIGAALIDASQSVAKRLGCAYMMVGTHPDNRAAQEVYRAAGFADVDVSGPRFRIKF